MKKLICLFFLCASVTQAQLTNSLSAYWNFESSYNSNRGSINAVLTTSVTNSNAFGKIHQGVGCNSSSSDLEYNQNTAWNFPLSDFTVNAWHVRGNPGSGQTAYWLGNCSSSGNTALIGVLFGYTSNDKSQALVASGGAILLVLASTGSALTSTTDWHMYTLVRSSGVFTFYVDGVSVATDNTHTSTTVNYSTANWGFGRAGTLNTNKDLGSTDEVGIWARALSTTEINKLYNGGAGRTYPFISKANFNTFN